jgi:phosphoribosylamine--glycine ligase
VTGDQLTTDEAVEYIRASEWEEWVIEERLVGEEFTVQAFVANGAIRPTPAVQDHKRAYEGDEGPNTGGMGSYSDAGTTLPFMTQTEYDAAVDIMGQTVDALPEYRGVLYGQFMLTADGPKVVEFNARFGDPEAMNTLPVLESDLLDVLVAARDGDTLPELEFAPTATVCKYAVPEGYPTNPQAGAKVTLDETTVGDALLYYASVDEREDGIYTTSSRSFAVVGRGATIEAAERQAAAALENVEDGFHIRHDIGTAALVRKRIDHMDEIRGGS